MNSKKISLKKEYRQHELLIINPNFMSTVINILVMYAIRRTPRGGQITIAANRNEAEGRTIIQISDTGPAVAPDEAPRVFEKFFLASEEVEWNTERTGLGPYIVKSLMDLIGGMAWIDSKGGRTTFSVSFPCRSIPERRRHERQEIKQLPGA